MRYFSPLHDPARGCNTNPGNFGGDIVYIDQPKVGRLFTVYHHGNRFWSAGPSHEYTVTAHDNRPTFQKDLLQRPREMIRAPEL